MLVDDPTVRQGLINALTDYTAVYGKGCTPPSSTNWRDPDNNVAFGNKTIVMTHNATISIAAAQLDASNNATLTEAQRAQAKKNYTELIATAGFPTKPDGTKMTYRAAVKTGVIFKDAKNKAGAKKFVAFLLEDANLTPYIEGSLGRWFPVTKAAQQSAFWKSDPHRLVVYNQFMAGTTPFEFTKNYKFAQLNNENVWAKAMNRDPQRQGAGGQGRGRDDRPHQDGRGQLTLALSACRVGPLAGPRFLSLHGRPLPARAGRPGPLRHRVNTAVITAAASPRRLTRWEWWGRMLVVPYLVVFVVFVVYPVGYGLWLARNPQSYVRLFEDPIFFRTAVNTVVFLLVAVNVKMVIALGLSGFFIQTRWWIKVTVAAVHPALGGALHPDHSLGALPAQPRVGRHQHDVLSPHRAGRAELAQRPDAGADPVDADAHLEEPAVLDPDLRRRAARDPQRTVRGRQRRRRLALAEVPLHHLALDDGPVFHVDDPVDDLDAG